MTLQIRPKGSMRDEDIYAPHRDIANCYQGIVRRAIEGCRPENWEPWLADIIAQRNIELKDLATAAVGITKAFQLYAEPETYPKLDDALQGAGYFDASSAGQEAFNAMVGKMFLSTVFWSIRDVTVQGEKPPRYQALQQMLAQAEEMSRVLIASAA